MLFQPPSWCRGRSWERGEMPGEGTAGRAPLRAGEQGQAGEKGSEASHGAQRCPPRWVTYQISLLTGIPRRSLGAFPALEGRKRRG